MRDFVFILLVRTNPVAETEEPPNWEVFAVYETPEALETALHGLYKWVEDIRITVKRVH